MHALVIDASALVRSFLEHALRRLGFEPHLEAETAAAWRRLHTEGPFSLVLLEDALPDSDGIALLQRIRSDLTFRGSRIVMLQRAEDPLLTTLARREGADACLAKPFGYHDLAAVIAKFGWRRE